MMRIHRRVHFLLWPVVALATALGLLLALKSVPADPYADIPAAAITDRTMTDGAR